LAAKRQFTRFERLVIAVAYGGIAAAAIGGVWAVLVIQFAACCGDVAGNGLLDPARSPFGYWPTILVVWPAAGFVCFLLSSIGEGLPDIIRAIGKTLRALVSKLIPV
jgi:hypothetical protein